MASRGLGMGKGIASSSYGYCQPTMVQKESLFGGGGGGGGVKITGGVEPQPPTILTLV